MKIFEVRLSADSEDKLSELARCLAESFAELPVNGRLETDPAHGLIVYRCAGEIPDERQRLAIHSRAAAGMAEYVVGSVEPELIRIMIRKYYPCGDEDVERIAELCMRMLGDRPVRPDGVPDAGGPGPLAGNGQVRYAGGRGADRNGIEAEGAAVRANEGGDAERNGGAADAVSAKANEGAVRNGSSAKGVPARANEDAVCNGSATEGVPARANEGRDTVREGAAGRKRHIAAELFAWLRERPSLHLEGYITFRLDKYWEELAEAAEAAVDEFVMDRQYREFVELLSEFVGRQQPRVPAVNLVLKADGGFALYDEDFRPMEPGDGARMAPDFADGELNVEDMVVSCLLAISPRTILLHARDPELPVVRTIGAIFGGRVTVCAGCGSCLPLTGAVRN